jgi:hypothetical protein
MSASELSLFSSFLACSEHYFEFGSGGSTCHAVTLVKTSVTTIDSSRKWLEDVAKHCVSTGTRIMPKLIHVDIGPTGPWGYPTDQSRSGKWPIYHSAVWGYPAASGADLYLVDGRFRVACFMQIILHCRIGSLILFHDFASRKEYHAVRDVAREIAAAEDLSVFLPFHNADESRTKEILKKYEFATS